MLPNKNIGTFHNHFILIQPLPRVNPNKNVLSNEQEIAKSKNHSFEAY